MRSLAATLGEMIKRDSAEKDQPEKTHSSAFVNLLIRALDDHKLRANLANDVESTLKGVDLGGELTKDEMVELRAIFSAVAAGHVQHETYACPYRGYS